MTTKGLYADTSELINSGELDDANFEMFRRHALGYRFALKLDQERQRYSFVSSPGLHGPNRALFLDQTGIIRASRNGRDPSHGEPLRF